MAVTERIKGYLNDWNSCTQMTHLASLDDNKLDNTLQDWRIAVVAQDPGRGRVIWLPSSVSIIGEG